MREFKPDAVVWGKSQGRWLAGCGVVVVVALFTALGGFATVQAGHRGVKMRFGRVIPGVLGEGLHFKLPFADEILAIDVREQKLEDDTSAASKDLQTVTTRVAVNFQPEAEVADKLYQGIGLDYEAVILRPAVEETVKAVTAGYTAEELITKRTEVRHQIEEALKERVRENHIRVTKFNIVNFEFSREFNRAIESKQTAEQEALQAQNILRRIEIEAKQKIEQARGEAESVKLAAAAEAEAIRLRAEAEAKAQELLGKVMNKEVLRLRAIEKWDGILPRVTGNAIPFLQLLEEEK